MEKVEFNNQINKANHFMEYFTILGEESLIKQSLDQ